MRERHVDPVWSLLCAVLAMASMCRAMGRGEWGTFVAVCFLVLAQFGIPFRREP